MVPAKGMVNLEDFSEGVSVIMHAAKDACGRVIWVDVMYNRKTIRDAEELKLYFGEGAHLEWVLMDAFGNAENVTKGMPGIRTENDGFFLHVEERIARQGRMTGCLLVVD